MRRRLVLALLLPLGTGGVALAGAPPLAPAVAPVDAASGTVRFLFAPPPGASPADLCRLVEVRAVRLVPQPEGEPHEAPATRPAPVQAEPAAGAGEWDRTCRFTLRGLEAGSTWRIRARIVASPWWGRSWEYQETCPRAGGIQADGTPGTHACEPIRN